MAQLAARFLDLGEIHYLVDSDYRTQAQGWSRADRTGPLDLWIERHRMTGGAPAAPGYVFRTGDYANDTVCIQAANDAMIDFRGDVMLFTPGAYAGAASPASAITLDVADARLLGVKSSCPENARASFTAGLAAQISVAAAADRLEVANLKFVPLTASHIFAVADGANNLHFHDFYYDTNGITANTGTQMFLCLGAMDNSVIERFVMHTDGAQGPFLETDGAIENLRIENFRHYHNAGTLAISVLDVDGAVTSSIYIGNGRGIISGGGAVTNLATIADQTANTVMGMIENFVGCVGYCGATALIAVAGAGAEFNITQCYLALADAAVAATFNANVTDAAPAWQTFTPYTS